MKILSPVEMKSESLKLMTYEDALKYIWTVFGLPDSDCKFTESCICGFSANIENCQMQSFNIIYSKVGFEIEGKLNFWPIQKYTRSVSLEEGIQLLETLRKT